MDVITLWTQFSFLFLLTFSDTTASRFTYHNLCNRSIVLDGNTNGGTLEYSMARLPARCFIQITTRPNYILRYRFQGLRPCFCNSPGECYNKVKLYSNDQYMTSMQYCEGKHAYASYTDLKSATLALDMNFENITDEFSFQFYTAHYGTCEDNEVECDGCLDKDIACDSGWVQCMDSSVCTDTSSKSFDLNAIAGIIVAGILFILLIFTCYRWHRQNSRTSSWCACCGRSDEERTISAQAREMFINQLASRGVDSNRVGSSNEAFSADGERVDPSLAEAPPEYSSLENIDKKWKYFTEDEDMPPSYDDALENQEKYKVVDCVQHI